MSSRCQIKPYIMNLPNEQFSGEYKYAINEKHNEIFDEIHETKAFRLNDGVLYLPKSNEGVKKAISTLAEINQKYGSKVAALAVNSKGKQVVRINAISITKDPDAPLYGEQGKLFSTSSLSDNTSLKEGLEWLKQIMPDVSPIIVQGLIDNIANGSYNTVGDIITLSEQFANKQVVKEEAFHRVFNLLPKEEQEKLLNEGSKKYGIDRGISKATIKYSQADQNKINYILKSVDILQSPKADEIFRKGDKNNWSLDKILQELQVPKEQQELIKSFNTRNREEILTSLLANYSYTIEINTAKTPKVGEKFLDREYGYELDVTEETLQNQIRDGFVDSNLNTQYYSNLTVPGGTNYTENELATPAITPSIKGHAQFATNNGIGWVRSDDRKYTEEIETEELENEEDDTSAKLVKSYPEIGGPKTRRILEVQSDLFQKGRDKEELVKMQISEGLLYKLKNIGVEKGQKFNIKGTWFQVIDSKIQSGRVLYQVENINNKSKTSWVTNDTIYKAAKDFYETKNSSNNFLSLLNKDNNWVTFFVKSIIQDSAKKGYEKVLFPSGNTASKIEGHSTLEEFKKEKENRIKELEKEIKTPKSFISRGGVKYFTKDDKYFAEDHRSTTLYELKPEIVEVKEEFYKNTFEYTEQYERNVKEINQLKQELERVEKEGFAALRPIYNFYENTVTNILKKQGYNPTLITDEYGNTWNEISITPKMLESIRLNTPKGKIEYSGDLAIEEKMAEEAFNSKDEQIPKTLIGKFIQSIRNLLRNIYKEKDRISRLIRNLNQGRLNNLRAQGNQQTIKGALRYNISENNTPTEIKPGVEELFNENETLANAVYEALGFNQMITSNDKVVFGHPTIGKSFLKKHDEERFITLDDDYANEVNAFVDANRGSETRQEYKGRKPKEYNEFMLNLYDRLKAQAQREGKILFVSNTNILKERMSDFDKVITIPKNEFKKRFDARGATYGFEDWKSDIDATVAKVPTNKVISTSGYLADLFITPQQKQQATFMFSEFLDVYLQDFEQVERILKEEKIIDKKCS